METMAHLGGSSTFSGLAARNWGGTQRHYQSVSSFPELFHSLERGSSELALLPVENSLAGAVDENLDLLSSNDLWIAGETYFTVELCLGACRSVEAAGLTHVVSHPKALAQCTNFFAEHPHIAKVIADDTASAAAHVARESNPARAAIASPAAMKDFGLCLLTDQVADFPKNATRFFVISRKPKGHVKGNKATVMLTLEHKPGALAEVLSQFAALNINLTSIESRPIKTSPFEYRFYLDLTLPESCSDEMVNILQCAKAYKILGVYEEAS